MSEDARLASVSAAPNRTAPHSVVTRAPQRSLAAPQPKEPKAITMKLMVIANEIPARDQPVSPDIGARNTARENIAPIATQPMRPPSATMAQRYGDALIPVTWAGPGSRSRPASPGCADRTPRYSARRMAP